MLDKFYEICKFIVCLCGTVNDCYYVEEIEKEIVLPKESE